MADLRLAPRALPAIAFAVGLTLTLSAWGLASAYVVRQSEDRFVAEGKEFESILRERMDAYELLLLGGVGLFEVNGGWVSREQWAEYAATLELQERFPGIQGFGFAERVRGANLSEHVERVRAEGFPQYTVFPEGEREVFVPVVYLEPFETRNQRAFGFDMFSEPRRQAAMVEARDTGEPTLSAKVRLVQENGTDVQPGFLLYAPVYQPGLPIDTPEQRDDALIGYVFSPFRSRDFLAGVEEPGRVELALRIYDGRDTTPESLLISRLHGGRLGDVTRTVVIEIAQHEWTLVESTTALALPPGLSLLPLSVMLGGVLATGLLVWVVFALSRTRHRAEQIAREMTSTLQARTQELEASNEALRAFSYVVSHDLKEPVRGIDAYLRVVREDHARELAPEALTMLDRAQLASARLASLLRGLLDLSRVDRGLLTPQPIDIAEIIRQDACHSAYETLERERDAKVFIEEMPRVLAAPSVLSQALGNIIGNAIRHGARDSPRVLVRGSQHGAVVEIVIEDDGAGFPPGFVEAFNRGQPASNGFGLLIAQRAIERLQGRLVLGRGERLGGAEVRITLPAAPPRPREDARADPSARPARTRASTRASR